MLFLPRGTSKPKSFFFFFRWSDTRLPKGSHSRTDPVVGPSERGRGVRTSLRVLGWFLWGETSRPDRMKIRSSREWSCDEANPLTEILIYLKELNEIIPFLVASLWPSTVLDVWLHATAQSASVWMSNWVVIAVTVSAELCLQCVGTWGRRLPRPYSDGPTTGSVREWEPLSSSHSLSLIFF